MITPRKTGSKLASLWGDGAGTVSPRRSRICERSARESSRNPKAAHASGAGLI
jgi:hypothetical protein